MVGETEGTRRHHRSSDPRVKAGRWVTEVGPSRRSTPAPVEVVTIQRSLGGSKVLVTHAVGRETEVRNAPTLRPPVTEKTDVIGRETVSVIGDEGSPVCLGLSRDGDPSPPHSGVTVKVEGGEDQSRTLPRPYVPNNRSYTHFPSTEEGGGVGSRPGRPRVP